MSKDKKQPGPNARHKRYKYDAYEGHPKAFKGIKQMVKTFVVLLKLGWVGIRKSNQPFADVKIPEVPKKAGEFFWALEELSWSLDLSRVFFQNCAPLFLFLEGGSRELGTDHGTLFMILALAVFGLSIFSSHFANLYASNISLNYMLLAAKETLIAIDHARSSWNADSMAMNMLAAYVILCAVQTFNHYVLGDDEAYWISFFGPIALTTNLTENGWPGLLLMRETGILHAFTMWYFNNQRPVPDRVRRAPPLAGRIDKGAKILGAKKAVRPVLEAVGRWDTSSHAQGVEDSMKLYFPVLYDLFHTMGMQVGASPATLLFFTSFVNCLLFWKIQWGPETLLKIEMGILLFWITMCSLADLEGYNRITTNQLCCVALYHAWSSFKGLTMVSWVPMGVSQVTKYHYVVEFFVFVMMMLWAGDTPRESLRDYMGLGERLFRMLFVPSYGEPRREVARRR